MFNIRTNVFETNSSSTHTLVLCDKDEYTEWITGKKLYNLYHDEPHMWRVFDKEKNMYVETEKGVPPTFVTEEEATYYDSNYPYPKAEVDCWKGDELEYITQNGEYYPRKFLTFKEYIDIIGDEYYTFEDLYTTPNGEEVIAFGYFGYDG